MPRTPKFKWSHDPKRGWKVNVPASVSASGKRERSYFPTRDKAKAFAEEQAGKYREHGNAASVIRPAVAEDAIAALDLLKPWGKSLMDAARHLVAVCEANAASRPTGEALDAWLASCVAADLRPRSLKGYKQAAERIRKALGERILNTITADELAAALGIAGKAGSSAAGYYRNARAFWRYAAGKKWCMEEVYSQVDAPQAKKGGKIFTLTPTEAAHLLTVAAEHYPQAVASFALQLFAGIRAEEVTRLEAKDVSADGIELGEEVTKKGRRRHITPSETLAAWLTKYPFTPCAEWDKISKACRYLAGWKVTPDAATLKAHPMKDDYQNRPAWPQNVLRHSHASYTVASGAPLETLLFEFGHVGKTDVLREHYVGKVAKKDALAYFAIVPKGAAKPKKFQTVKGAA
jgi:site-specific recombinase XerD